MTEKTEGWAKINGVKYPTVVVDGVQRFRENRIIRDLVDAGREGRRLDLNEIAIRTDKDRYSRHEQQELYRLIGYSICGFAEVFDEDEIQSSDWQEE